MRFQPILALSVAVLLSTPVPSAHAQDLQIEGSEVSEYDDDTYFEMVEHWYGWQTLLVDVPLATTYFFAQRADESALAMPAFGGFVLGAPIIHVAHGRQYVAVFSVSTHLMLPVLGLLLLRPAVAEIDPSASVPTRTAWGVGLGMAGATAIDAVFFANKDVATARTYTEDTTLRWAPSVSIQEKGFSLGISGAF